MSNSEYHLALKSGAEIPHDGKLGDYIDAGGDTMYVKKGPGNTFCYLKFGVGM